MYTQKRERASEQKKERELYLQGELGERGVVSGERESFFLALAGRRCDCAERDCFQCVSGTERERIILLHCRKPKLTERERERITQP